MRIECTTLAAMLHLECEASLLSLLRLAFCGLGEPAWSSWVEVVLWDVCDEMRIVAYR